MDRHHPSARFAVAACAWSAFVVLLAFVLPLAEASGGRSGHETLVHADGYVVLWKVAVPLVVCVVILVLLGLARREPSMAAHSAYGLAWVLAVLLLLGAIATAVVARIGILIVPSGALAIAACATGRRDVPA